MKGTVFDIKQFSIFDGPGIRTTVFLKGCPLRCQWCHNPEGLSPKPQLMVSHNGCTHCGRCKQICPTPEHCTSCGKCIRVCPLRLRKIAGTIYEADDLVAKLLKDKDYLNAMNGGITFSGGEPTMQADFLLECLQKLSSVHRAIETSGFCPPAKFAQIIKEVDYILMDIKLFDEQAHIAYTGVSNKIILKNLEQVKQSNKLFRIRIPVIPGVNDSNENFRNTARLLINANKNFQGLELLPYHQTAGAKYDMVKLKYAPKFDTAKKPNLNTQIFEDLGIPCKCL